MNFVKNYFFTNAALTSCPFLLSKIDFPVIKTLVKHSLHSMQKNVSNVLITQESNVDERSGQLIRVAFVKRQLLTKSIHILDHNMNELEFELSR